MSNDKFILDENGNAVPEPDIIKWSEWFETAGAKRFLASTKVGKRRVSTVFLGLDYNFHDKGRPLLWETMVFRPMTKKEAEAFNKGAGNMNISMRVKAGYETQDDDAPMERYFDRETALERHREIVEKLKKKK